MQGRIRRATFDLTATPKPGRSVAWLAASEVFAAQPLGR
jgi:hypothetical protein